ncbi:protein angel homolog 2 isoform X1 [Phycodurus eques]|uniref:protein angel homolog 2 isoform X1 n=2 Tax=Phycodurus eques TaxID=693459 RepID=UPI002ACE70E7|nr:protein angel homolog 2 isoform X1 [Phycodurus eques]XP_061552381.1 protein angel homolog 2 isoform X1 [Phycodurus eques]XP_061552382.1 protein angel homolog 2 isoform X1 [Phycodurus eques]
MIACLLFYALYPLSRYMLRRTTVVNGTMACDGAAITSRVSVKLEQILPDEQLGQSSWSTKHKEEKKSEQYSVEEDGKTREAEQLICVSQKDTKMEAASKTSEAQYSAKSSDSKGETDKQETPNEEVGKMHCGLKQPNIEETAAEGSGTMAWYGAAVTSTMPIKSQKILPDQRLDQSSWSTGQKDEKMSKQYFIEGNNKTPDAKQLICVRQKDTKIEAALKTGEAQYSAKGEKDKQEMPKEEVGKKPRPLKQPVQTAAEGSEQHVTCLMETVAKMKLLEDSGNVAECSRQEAECWDEYTDVMLTALTNSNRKQTSLLSSAKNHFDTQSGWHFPVGPGLVDEIHCPLWHFPAMSYYPSVERTRPFEVMWRLWHESLTEDSDTDVAFTKPSMDFTVMSYNILAQDLLEANMELYTHCPQEVLDWSNRCSLLLEEIHRWAPDILCLQEVQENHYQTQLYPVLTQMGYNCVYKRRTGNKTDGCATCYRSSRFSELSVTPIEFFRPQTELLDRHNVGILVVLRPVVYKESKIWAKGSLLCVANTHLLFNPSRGDVKLAQLAILLAEIDNVVKLWRAKGEHCNVIMCGDLNSVPHMPLYQLITTGELHFQGLPAWMVSGQKDLSHKATCHRLFAPLWPGCLGISDSCQYVTAAEVDASHSPVTDLLSRNEPNIRFQHIIRHQLDLESTYKHTIPDSGDSEVTTLHSEGAATVDYIFYSPERLSYQAAGQFGCEGLKLVGCLSLLSEDTLWSIEGLPSYIFPSDHLSLVAKFRLDLKAAAC